jgi:hypothetical protein
LQDAVTKPFKTIEPMGFLLGSVFVSAVGAQTAEGAIRLNPVLQGLASPVYVAGAHARPHEQPRRIQALASGTYSGYATPSFSVASSGSRTISLGGVGTGTDSTAFVDDVARAVAPASASPAQIALPAAVTRANCLFAKVNVPDRTLPTYRRSREFTLANARYANSISASL